MIRISGLTKSFGAHMLWSGLDYKFAGGKLHAITGPSGSGKTTLLNCVGLLEKPTDGQILLDDAPLTGLSGRSQQRYRRTRLGYLFQNYALVDNATAAFNIRIGLAPGRLTAGKKAIIADALNTVGLSGFEARRVYELSGGEQQRVALARLIAKRADVILADEPTGALDDSNTSMVLNTLQAMADGGATILIATHDHTVMDACSSRLVIPMAQSAAGG